MENAVLVGDEQDRSGQDVLIDCRLKFGSQDWDRAGADAGTRGQKAGQECGMDEGGGRGLGGIHVGIRDLLRNGNGSFPGSTPVNAESKQGLS